MNASQTTGLLMTILAAVSQFLDSLADRWFQLSDYIVAHLGIAGQWAFWALCAIAILVVIGFATRIVYNISRWIIIPAALLTIVGIILAPHISPMKSFPITLGAMTLVMLVRMTRRQHAI